MIAAIATNRPEEAAKLVSYLTARSLRHADLLADGQRHSTAHQANVLATLSDEVHHVVTGVRSPAELEIVGRRRDFRLLFVGPRPTDEDGAGLYEAANVRLEAVDDGALETAKATVLAGMADFERPDWDQYFMDIARVVARRSNCMKRKVAAVVVREKRIISTGYNGTPRGARNCNEGGCERCNSLTPSGTGLDDCRCNHAEENAIVQAAYHGISVRGGVLYCTFSPCIHCTKIIVNAGIEEVVYNAGYPLGHKSLELLRECNVRVRQFEG